MEARHKIAAGMAGVVALAGASAGLAAAQGGPGPSAPAVAPAAGAHRTGSGPMIRPAAPAPSEQGGETDVPTLQRGERGGPDAPDAPEADEREHGQEKETAEEAGDEQLPGGGHADPAGRDTEHQFEGTE